MLLEKVLTFNWPRRFFTGVVKGLDYMITSVSQSALKFPVVTSNQGYHKITLTVRSPQSTTGKLTVSTSIAKFSFQRVLLFYLSSGCFSNYTTITHLGKKRQFSKH